MINSNTIRRRITRNLLVVNQLGAVSSLASIEIALIGIIIQMARIRQILTPSKGLKLVNDMIHGTNTQVDLIKWKEMHPSNSSGTVGKKYWRKFMQRHGDKIRSKRGQKYLLDRAANWSTYANFGDMYDHNIEEMQVVGVAVQREDPV